MKKQVKMISILLILIMAITSLTSMVFAAGNTQAATDLSGTITDISNKASSSSVTTTGITDIGGNIVKILQTVGIVVAIVVILILGIKYMMGSAEERAEYKKTMIPYVVGAALIFGATTIVNVVYQLASGLNS